MPNKQLLLCAMHLVPVPLLLRYHGLLKNWNYRKAFKTFGIT